jgi:hypothetical protein
MSTASPPSPPAAPTPARPSTPAAEIASLFVATRVLARRLAQPQAPAAFALLQRRLVRLARALVRVAETNDPAFLGLTALADAHRDPPGRAALLTLVAIGTARELTTSRRALVRVALTVLLADLGEATPGDPRHAAERAASAVVGLLGADPGALLVADSVCEGVRLRALTTSLAPVERGELPPAVTSRIVQVARALLDRIAPADGSAVRSPLVALVEVGAMRTIDPGAFRCLVRALGLTPVGTVVELEGGEWAVVLPPTAGTDPAVDRPRLRLLTDASGRACVPPVEIDLAHPSYQGYRIARVVDPAAAAAYVAAAFVAAG